MAIGSADEIDEPAGDDERVMGAVSMGQGMATWHAMRSFTQDSSVTKRKLAPGTVKRIIKFAAPYKRWSRCCWCCWSSMRRSAR